ncbi:MAG: polysaccharide pyruvyl transferase family protein [Phycisphaerales bacterium]|jgi:polysaccharide pyruvyl transferase WcaK-like protein|nr:polysaccharide pyruvyl transferase family protein [Phycisphaerales bacterium]
MSGVARELMHGAARAFSSMSRSRANDGALIIPPAGPGSLGDEAMCEAVACMLRRAGVSPITLLARPGLAPWPDLGGVGAYVDPSGGGVVRSARVLSLMRRHRYLFVIGADCIDGHYSVANSVQLITLVDCGARMGCIATLVGSSYKAGARSETARALRRVHPPARLCSRDPVSQERMSAASGRTIQLVADAAFMLEPRELMSDQELVRGWIEAQGDRPILGVNFNHQVLHGASQESVDALHASYVEVIRRSHRELDASILLIPHDYRREPNDATYADRLFARLSPELGDRILRLPGRRTPGEIKHVAGMVDVVLTGRMHLAIACLGRGTPPACVTYQGKFEGLMRHFGLEGMTLDPERACDADALWVMVSGAMSRSAAMREQIRSRLESIQAMSRQNFPDELRSKIEASLSAERDGAPRERVAV